MTDVVKVWVKTAALDEAILGKSRSPTKRGLPGEDKSRNDDATLYHNNPDAVDWGWAKCVLEEEEDANIKDATTTRVRVTDPESAHDRSIVRLPKDAMEAGNLVVANVYAGDNDDNNDTELLDEFGQRLKEGDQYPDDLITLTHLHEPAVLYCLRKRYAYDKIYTATGPILLALNPFKSCDHLFNDIVMKQYFLRGEQSMLLGPASSSGEEKKSDGGDGDSTTQYLPPHVYGIADHSFRSMMLKLEEAGHNIHGGGRRSKSSSEPTKGMDQSILVSGESGAGKTVTAKFIMAYLATLSQRTQVELSASRANLDYNPNDDDDYDDEKKSVEHQVLQSNPILESFGNARTIRNDNSSRFGKFIEIQFTTDGTLVGASIETYLLEKVRLITQTEGERNYHIFYEILQGMEEKELNDYFLAEYTAEDFNLTNKSGTYDRRDGVEDLDTFRDLQEAMDSMNFLPQEKKDIWRVTCACLHLSNITFDSISADESKINFENDHLEPALQLLGIEGEALNTALCYFSIMAGKERHMRSISKEKAAKGMEALIKATYGALFTSLVQRINDSITLKEVAPRGGRGGGAAVRKAATIGVLDIFGFESFKTNSFEQLCINYCNEALQQQFNIFVLKNEQEEYEREGIQWSFISFPENQDVLDLIDKKGSGILNILDDQCRAPGTTDKTFANDVYNKCTGHTRFEANFMQVGALRFGVFHYAGLVEYDTGGFVEKNRDELPKEANELLLGSKLDFVKKLSKIISGEHVDSSGGRSSTPTKGRSPRIGRSAGARVTVGGQFSKQLKELRAKIDMTSPHYVRCLKPNDQLVPDHFDPLIITDQLRCAGVVEAVRVSRVGFPSRYTHAQFVQRYGVLGITALKKARSSSKNTRPVEALVNAIAEQVYNVEQKQVAQKSHEEAAGEKLSDGTVDLMSVGMQVGKTKVFLRRKAYEVIESLRSRRMVVAAIIVQATARRHIQSREWNAMKDSVLLIQSVARMRAATVNVQHVRETHNAILIQTQLRRMVARNKYAAIIMVTRWLQKMQRGRKGRAKYDELNQIRKATVLQTLLRQKRANKEFMKKKNGALTIQCAFRSSKARRELKALRVASRDLNATKKQSESLKSEMQRLKAELKEAKAFADAESQRVAAAEVATLASSSNLSSAELDELKSELASVSKQLEASRIRAKEESARADAAEESAEDLMQQMKEAHRASMKLKKELKAAGTEPSVERSHEPSSGDFDDEKFLAMKEELDEANRKLAAGKMEGRVGLTSTGHLDQSESDQLQKELESAKEAAEMASNEIDELTNINEQLQVELEAAMEGMPEAPMMAGGPDFASPLPSKELMAARKEIKSLKAELADQRKELRASESVGQGEAAAEEILTLQDEVDSLNGELLKARSSVARSMDNDKNMSTSPSNAHDAELRKLSDDVKRKDHKIDELRTELKIIKEEIERADAMTNGDGGGRNGEIRPTSENPLALDDSHGASIGHVASLRIENEKIRKRARAVGLECSELKLQLRKQTVQTIQELSNLAEALEEVDQLRRKSESRTRAKKPQMNKNMHFMAEDTSGHVNARTRSSRNLNGRQQPASTLFEDGLWKRVRAGVIMATVGESTVSEDVSNYDGQGGRSKSRKQLRRGSSVRRRNKDSDDSSVTSAYF
eukprot:CAMPEP_0198288208 /NCGR_PEP_ID=MMETSP1449-20131203/6799_1 /TAXON_ID=420275 /ORGANISM="Attheya septentrionalis, Strain CCMP2084" /LENGTH=1645 /DNA_ID=CAMNT_0043986321 /DNA_START=45 /DNA_END=4982 /DNA_ORIENTATION=-